MPDRRTWRYMLRERRPGAHAFMFGSVAESALRTGRGVVTVAFSPPLHAAVPQMGQVAIIAVRPDGRSARGRVFAAPAIAQALTSPDRQTSSRSIADSKRLWSSRSHRDRPEICEGQPVRKPRSSQRLDVFSTRLAMQPLGQHTVQPSHRSTSRVRRSGGQAGRGGGGLDHRSS